MWPRQVSWHILTRAPRRNLITRIRTVVFGYVCNVYSEQLSRTVPFVYAWYAVFTSSGYLNKNLKQNGPKKYSKCCLKFLSPFLIVSGGQASLYLPPACSSTVAVANVLRQSKVLAIDTDQPLRWPIWTNHIRNNYYATEETRKSPVNSNKILIQRP